MRTVIYLMALLIVLPACKKKLKTKVEGTVIHAADNQPLEGAVVDLRELTGTVSNTGFKVIETAVSDANGNFNFDFKAHPGRSYTVIINDNEKYLGATKHGFNLSQKLETGKTNTVLLNPMKPSFSKMIIDGSHGNDSLRLKISHETVDTYTVNEIYKSGYFFESNITDVFSGKYFYEKKIYNNGTVNSEYDTIEYTPYQEYLIEINF